MCNTQWILLTPSLLPLSMFGGVSFGKGERESRQIERAQNRKAKATKEKLTGYPVSPRASPEGGDKAGAAWNSRLMKNQSHSAAVTIDFSFQAACKLPQESMSEGENKFLKLAQNILQEKAFA